MRPRALGLLAPIVLLLGACKTEPPRAQSELLDRGVPKSDDAVSLEGVTIHRFDGDRVVLVGQMRTARVDRERGRADGEDVLILTLDREGESKARVAAPRGQADFGEHTLLLEGGVRARDREGRILTTETLRYARDTDEVEAPGPVVIEGQNFRAQGASMRGLYGEQRIEVAGPLSARIAP